MARSEATVKTTIPQTILSHWDVELWPRNTNREDTAFNIGVKATSKQEAINKALAQYPGHAWGRVVQLDVACEEVKSIFESARKAHEGSKIHDIDDSKPYDETAQPAPLESETELSIYEVTVVHDVDGGTGDRITTRVEAPNTAAAVLKTCTDNPGWSWHGEITHIRRGGFAPESAEWADKESEPCDGETAEPQLSEEDRQRRIQRNADKAGIIELILSYRNVASDEEKLRQIRVVMD